MQAEAMPLVQTLNLTEVDEPSMYALFPPLLILSIVCHTT
jgi:hypothetical protein